MALRLFLLWTLTITVTWAVPNPQGWSVPTPSADGLAEWKASRETAISSVHKTPSDLLAGKRSVATTSSQSSLVLAPIIPHASPIFQSASAHATTQSTSTIAGILSLVPLPLPPATSTKSVPAPLVIPSKPATTSAIPPPPVRPPQQAFPPPVKPPIPAFPPIPNIPHVEPLPTAKPPKPFPPPDTKPTGTKPSSSQGTTQSSCETTMTPTVTVSISYPLDSYGVFHTTTTTIRPKEAEASCKAQATTTTTTAKFQAPSVTFYSCSMPDGPRPTVYPEVDKRVQEYIGKLFKSLDIQDTETATSTSSAPHATATCDGKTYVEAIPNAAAFIQGLIPKFCSEWSAKPGDTMSKVYTAKDVKGRFRRQSTLIGRTPPPAPLTQSSYPGWSIDFEWRADHATGDCLKQEYCANALTTLLSQCKGYSLADAYTGGQTQDECGTFRYTIKGYPAIKSADTTCDLPTINDPGSKNTPHEYSQKAFEAAATMFCQYRKSELLANPQGSPVSAFYWENTAAIDPRTNLPAICYPDGDSSYSYSIGNSWDLCKAHPMLMPGRYDSDSNIGLSIIPSPSQEGCSPLGIHKIPRGDDCYKNFMQVVSSCMPGDGGGKIGVWKESSEDGCWDWWMWGRELYQ